MEEANDFKWMEQVINPSQITHWTEYLLREYLKQTTDIIVEVYMFWEFSEPSYRGIWKLSKNNKRYTIERNVTRSEYGNNGWRSFVSTDKEHYRIGQVIEYLNKKEWVIKK